MKFVNRNLIILNALLFITSVIFYILSITVINFKISLFISFLVVAIISFLYLLYCYIRLYPSIKKKIIFILSINSVTRHFVESYRLRTFVYAAFFLIINFGYSGINIILGIITGNAWYITMGGYYLALSFARFLILTSVRKVYKKKNDIEIEKLKIYRNSGIVLLFLNILITAAVIQMSLANNPFKYTRIILTANIIYTFVKMGLAIYNLIKAKRYKDPSVQALRNINLTSALVSLVSLQSAVIAFSSIKVGENYMMINITSGLICLILLSICLSMIINGTRKLNQKKSDH